MTITEDTRHQIVQFFEDRASTGQARVRATLLWLHVQECLRWPTPDGSDDTAAMIKTFVGRLSEHVGEDNAVEFRLRFL